MNLKMMQIKYFLDDCLSGLIINSLILVVTSFYFNIIFLFNIIISFPNLISFLYLVLYFNFI